MVRTSGLFVGFDKVFDGNHFRELSEILEYEVGLSETDIAKIETSGEATEAMLDEMESRAPTAMMPSFGGDHSHEVEAAGAKAGGKQKTKKGQQEDDEKKKEREAKKESAATKIAEKAQADEATLMTMSKDPPAYVSKWQKAVIADLGVGTTLVENLALQDLMYLWARTTCKSQAFQV